MTARKANLFGRENENELVEITTQTACHMASVTVHKLTSGFNFDLRYKAVLWLLPTFWGALTFSFTSKLSGLDNLAKSLACFSFVAVLLDHSNYSDEFNVITMNRNDSQSYKNQAQVIINQNDPFQCAFISQMWLITTCFVHAWKTKTWKPHLFLTFNVMRSP